MTYPVCLIVTGNSLHFQLLYHFSSQLTNMSYIYYYVDAMFYTTKKIRN